MWSALGRIAGSVALVAASWLALLFVTPEALAYVCGNPSEGHCYATATWSEQPEYFGAYTDIVLANIDCSGPHLRGRCDGFVDDEIWLIDDRSAECIGNEFGGCWVEAGYIHVAGEPESEIGAFGAEHYFWAENTPTSGFHYYALGPVTDPVGATGHFMIIKDSRGSPGIFQVWIYNDSLSTLYNGTSTGNTMRATRIDIGQELAGTVGARADCARFRRNIWAVGPLEKEYVFWYNRQIDAGAVTSQQPPVGWWSIDPGSASAPEGGEFTTACCSEAPPPYDCSRRRRGGGGNIPTHGGQPECKGEDTPCRVHPPACESRGRDWLVDGRLKCLRPGVPECVAVDGEDYCSTCGGICGGCDGNSCSEGAPCGPASYCLSVYPDPYQCWEACPIRNGFCWLPSEVGQEAPFGCQ
jgi:hypothetical protein